MTARNWIWSTEWKVEVCWDEQGHRTQTCLGGEMVAAFRATH